MFELRSFGDYYSLRAPQWGVAFYETFSPIILGSVLKNYGVHLIFTTIHQNFAENENFALRETFLAILTEHPISSSCACNYSQPYTCFYKFKQIDKIFKCDPPPPLIFCKT